MRLHGELERQQMVSTRQIETTFLSTTKQAQMELTYRENGVCVERDTRKDPRQLAPREYPQYRQVAKAVQHSEVGGPKPRREVQGRCTSSRRKEKMLKMEAINSVPS